MGFTKTLISMNKLLVLAQAWNNLDQFYVKFDDVDQAKHYPLFIWDAPTSRYVFSHTETIFDIKLNSKYSICGIYFWSKVRAEEFGETFIDLWNNVLLPPYLGF
jgi:hypothetical protein